MNIEDMTPELKEQAKACKTKEEFLEFAKRNLIALSDEQVEGLAGGSDDTCNIGWLCIPYEGGWCVLG